MFVDPFPEEEISDYPGHGPIIRVLTVADENCEDKEKEKYSGSRFMKELFFWVKHEPGSEGPDQEFRPSLLKKYQFSSPKLDQLNAARPKSPDWGPG